MTKRLISVLLAVLAVFTMTATAFAATPRLEEVDYEGRGIVEVDFRRNVQYKNLKVTVTDAAGVTVTARVLEKDNDDLSFRVPQAKPGKYTFAISGVRSGRSGEYETVTGEFRIPSRDPLIREIEYDREDRELELEFAKRVQYKNLKVTITDETGKTYRCRIEDRDCKELELKVRGLKRGQKYTVTLSGIRARGETAYSTVVSVFKVK